MTFRRILFERIDRMAAKRGSRHTKTCQILPVFLALACQRRVAQENYAMIKPNVGPEVIEALQLADVARKLSCSRRFLEKQVAAGRLRVVRLSPRCVRVRPTDLADYLERNAI
jgi:excisionase family DNA binding protein